MDSRELLLQSASPVSVDTMSQRACDVTSATRGKARVDLRNLCLCVMFMPVHVDCMRELGAVGVTEGNNWTVGTREDPQLHM